MDTTTSVTSLALTTGGRTGRTRCRTCKALFPRYFDRGDGQPLRLAEGAEWTRVDGKLVPPATDPTLGSGRCAMVAELLPNCPACNAPWGIEFGRPTEDTEIKGTFGSNACDTVCAFATGATCKCQCGGMNHGTRG